MRTIAETYQQQAFYLSVNDLKTGTDYKGIITSSGNYGWIQIELEATTGTPQYDSGGKLGYLTRPTFTKLSILQGCFNNTGGVIEVGQACPVPEPSSFAYLGLLAAGAGGVFALKKFRKQQLIEEAKA